MTYWQVLFWIQTACVFVTFGCLLTMLRESRKTLALLKKRNAELAEAQTLVAIAATIPPELRDAWCKNLRDYLTRQHITVDVTAVPMVPGSERPN